MGGLHGGFRSFSVALFVFLNLPLGRFTRGPRSFSVALFVFFKFAFGAVYTGNPFFLRFQCGAVLYFRCMARGARFWLCFLLCLGVWGAGLGLPSVGFVNAV